VHQAVVADAGGLLVLAGLLEGVAPEAAEIVALDATSLLLAEYLAIRHDGAVAPVTVDYALVERVVAEWIPVRAVAVEAALASTTSEVDVEAAASLVLAESLGLPLVTKHRDVVSRRVEVLYC